MVGGRVGGGGVVGGMGWVGGGDGGGGYRAPAAARREKGQINPSNELRTGNKHYRHS